jgi:translocation and assembly module TamA
LVAPGVGSRKRLSPDEDEDLRIQGQCNRVLRDCWSIWLVAVALLLLQPTSARAFELFGIHLWGEKAEDPNDVVVDPVAYDVDLTLAVDDLDLLDELKRSSLLFTMKNSPPSGRVGLLQRARDDQANIVGKLYEDGRFGAVVRITIDGRGIDGISVTDAVAVNATRAAVNISVDPGPLFTFGNIAVEGMPRAVAAETLAAAGLSPGARASSLVIRRAAQELVIASERQGHPYARIAGQDIVANHAARTVDVKLVITSGPRAVLGTTEVTGADRLDPDFIARQAEIPTGVPYSPDVLEQARKNLARIDALGSAIVKPAERLDGDGSVPIMIEVSERKPRTLGVGAYYSSTDGPGGEFFWLHRNLFGQGEKLRIELEAGRALTSNSFDNFDTYNWSAGFRFDKPGVYGPRVDWLVSGVVLQDDTNPYFRRGGEIATGVSYRWSEALTLEGSLYFDHSYVEDYFSEKHYSILGMPLTATYDTRNDTSGIYAQLRAEPAYVFDESDVFLTGDSELRLYRAFAEDERFVLAARVRVGSIVSADLEDVPAHRRFYAGGAGSVRGYEYLDIGPRVPGYGPTGGLSRVDGSLEARIGVTNTIAIVPFIDGGYVAETSLFGGDEDFRWSAGLGLRYMTAVGPIRLDAAVPIDPRPGDPAFAVYFGIGQSF